MWRDQKTLTCGLYTRVVDDDRFHATIAAIEATLPTEPLVYAVSRSATPVQVDDPGAWVKGNLMARRTKLICNGNEHAFVRLMASPISPYMVLEDEPITFMTIKFPDTPAFTPRVPALIRAVGPAARACWADASPSDTVVAIIEGAGRTSPPPEDEAPQAPTTPIAMPRLFGWLNYWSSESCRLLDFSPEDPRAEVFAHVTPIAGHGVTLQLTEAPLDVTRAEHLAALTAAYKAFPVIEQARSP